MLSLALPPGPLSVLCVGAHPDDIEIGCGGALLTLAATRPLTVTALLLTGDDARVAESRAALTALTGGEISLHAAGLPDGRLPAHWGQAKQFLEGQRSLEDQRASHDRAAAPDVIFAPRREDAHQDHAVAAELISTVWRDSLVLRYEVPKWDGDLGPVDTYLPLSPEVARRKVAVLNEHFASQHGRDWWDDELFFGLMRLRGIECRHRYAEGFVCTKAVFDLSS